MSKRIYPDQDINDLVEQDLNHEEEFFKGGKGSGVKGHTTPREQAAHHEREYRRLYTLADDFESSSDPEVRATGKKYREEGNKHEGLAEAAKKQSRLSQSNDSADEEREAFKRKEEAHWADKKNYGEDPGKASYKNGVLTFESKNKK